MRNWALLAMAAAAMAGVGTASAAEEPYVVGLSGAMTGRGADTYAPVIESLRLYVERVNAHGGVNGHPIKVVPQDDQGEPSKAAANVKRFLSQDNSVLVMNVSLSSTYAPMIADIKKARVPLFFAGSVCPAETYPPADELLFCSTAFGAKFDSRFALDFLKKNAGGEVKLGLVSMAIPVSRGEIDFAEDLAKGMGFTPVDKQSTPPVVPDYTPFATKLQSAGANWVYTWAPWGPEVKTFEALRQLNWTGKYITSAHIQAEDDLARVKDPGFYAFGANAFFEDNSPGHQDIREAAKGASLTYPVSQLTEGWVAGMVLEEILRKVPWPATAEKVLAAMNTVKVDTKGLRGGPIEWTPTNHFRTVQNYRVWHWDPAHNAVVRLGDWTPLEVK